MDWVRVLTVVVSVVAECQGVAMLCTVLRDRDSGAADSPKAGFRLEGGNLAGPNAAGLAEEERGSWLGCQ